MSERIDTDICVIGAGSGGLTVAAGAAQMGARTVLIEKGEMGGDCLNYGCVPSKALIAAATAAAAPRQAAAFGVELAPARVDFARVRDHVRGVIAAIAPNDSVARFTGLGVRVIRAAARFVGPDEVAAGDARVRAKRFVIATGSSPLVPPIAGLADAPYLTNETIFDLAARPDHLLVIGGGPIGAELAQAFRRLGSAVTVIEAGQLLGREDAELADVVRRSLVADGIVLHEGAAAQRVSRSATGVVVAFEKGGLLHEAQASHLLVAVGRRANVDGLGLDAAGVAHTAKGIQVDAGLRTANKRVFAIGDVAGGLQFTHVAGHHAGIVLRRALFRLPAKASVAAVPRVTYCDPELAAVGLDAAAAQKRHGAVRILRWPFAENDRAQTERAVGGFAKVVATPGGRVLGAAIVGRHAGELILPWVFAVQGKLKLGDLAGVIAPYPTLGEVSKRAAGSFYAPKLFSEATRRLVRLLLRLP